MTTYPCYREPGRVAVYPLDRANLPHWAYAAMIAAWQFGKGRWQDLYGQLHYCNERTR
jgi:hypothetical protein